MPRIGCFFLIVSLIAACTPIRYKQKDTFWDSAYGYQEVKTGDRTWLLSYSGFDMQNAVEGFNRRASELCPSGYTVSNAPGVNAGSYTSGAQMGAMFASQSTSSQTAYVTCK